MAALIALVASGLFASGVIAGIVGVVSVAIRREERKFTLTSRAPDNVTRAGRLLNGVYVRAPHRTAAAGRPTAPVEPRQHARPGISGTRSPGWPHWPGLPRKLWCVCTAIKSAPAPPPANPL